MKSAAKSAGMSIRQLGAGGPAGRNVRAAQSWQLVPSLVWASTVHQLVVAPVLEDLAGNSVSRVFDRDLARPEDRPRPARPVTIVFHPG
jgi:hypothetical protein